MHPPKPDRKPKAALVGLIGVALLVGSGATFALWNDEARLDPELIELGQLSVQAGDLTWYDVSTVGWDEASGWDNTDYLAAHAPIDVNSFRLVPGDVLFAHGQIASNLVGENLVAYLDLDPDGDFQVQVPDWVGADVQLIDPDTGEFVSSIEQRPGARDVSVRMLLDFPLETTDRMNDSVDLSALRVVLQQIPIEEVG